MPPKPRKLKRSPRTAPAQSGQNVAREYFVTLVVCSIFALFLTTFVVHPMSVPTPSMVPTILVGDRLLVDKFTLRNGLSGAWPFTPVEAVHRHDVIVCKSPLQPEILLVKRVVGMPGDELEIRDKQVYIDGQALAEPFVRHADPHVYARQEKNPLMGNMQRDNYGPVRVPDGHYFVMGDNRDDSLDSRYWGFLPRQNIVGRPLFVFWSFEDPPDAHLRTSLPQLLQLYGERVLFFLTRTRWTRTGHFIR